jgi:hypothetical protein
MKKLLVHKAEGGAKHVNVPVGTLISRGSAQICFLLDSQDRWLCLPAGTLASAGTERAAG